MLWMEENQFGRRNLPIITRVELIEKRKGYVKSRQGERSDLTSRENSHEVAKPSDQLTEKRDDIVSRQGTRSDLPTSAKNLAEVPRPRDQKAERAGVSKETYRAAKLILEAEASGEITPQLADDVRRNKVAVHRVAKDIKETRHVPLVGIILLVGTCSSPATAIRQP